MESVPEFVERDLGGDWGWGATTVPPNQWDELVERLSASEGLLEGGERKSTLQVLEEYDPDPNDPLSHITLGLIQRRLRKKVKRKKVHGNRKRAIRRKKMFEKGSRDMYSNWMALKSSKGLCHVWRLEFEDWMDVCEFISKKWDIDNPWEKTRDWSFRGRGSGELTLDTLMVVEKKTNRKLFVPEEFKMWKMGYCEL